MIRKPRRVVLPLRGLVTITAFANTAPKVGVHAPVGLATRARSWQDPPKGGKCECPCVPIKPNWGRVIRTWAAYVRETPRNATVAGLSPLATPWGSSRIDRAALDDTDQYKDPCGEIKAECGEIVILAMLFLHT